MLQVIAPAAAVAIPADAQPENALAHVRINLQSSCTPCPTILADTHNLASPEIIVTRKIWCSLDDQGGEKARAVVGEKMRSVGHGDSLGIQCPRL